MDFQISLYEEKNGQTVRTIFSYVEDFEDMSEARDTAVDAISEAAGDSLFPGPDGRRRAKFTEENVDGVVHMRILIETEDGQKILHITVEEVQS